MKITIDNLDGLGARDYTGAVCAEGPVTVERVLNAATRAKARLDVESAGLPVPVRRARVIVAADNGMLLFTGYCTTEPVPEFAGVASEGAVYRYALSALSDEWLLDHGVVPLSGPGLAAASSLVLSTLTERVSPGLIGTAGVSGGRTLGVFQPDELNRWSSNAGAAAGAGYAAYRVVNGALVMQPAGTVVHTFSDGDGTLSVGGLSLGQVKELANDVTVSGAIEPVAYCTETFAGDGTTTSFELALEPFAVSAKQALLLEDTFAEVQLSLAMWQVNDSGSHLSLGAGGVLLAGGNGLDGQTTVTAVDAVELGGSVVVEAGSVMLNAGSAGILCGLYNGVVEASTCFAGYNVRQNAGNTVLVPLLNGVEVGTVFKIVSGHRYTLRIRLHCVEMQRVLQQYYAMVEGVVEGFGGGLVTAPMRVVYELQDLGLSSNTPATVLYDSEMAGLVMNAPAQARFGLVNSLELMGSIGSCRVRQTGSAWVVSTLPSGAKQTRLIGVAGEGADCAIRRRLGASAISFMAGRVPVAGEYVTVLYRGRGRAIARAADATSIAKEAAGGAPGTAHWLGKVLRPEARCTADCASAAAAVLAVATSRSAALAGRYNAVNLQQTSDVWPGDVVQFLSNGGAVSAVVRAVEIMDGHAAPELMRYKVAFANDWSETLGLKLSESISTDSVLPLTSSGAVLGNLQMLQLTVISGTALQVDAGQDAPAGGGFEVRRRDGNFGAGSSLDLVLRSPVRSFSIPREGQIERYYVRMYDGGGVYSRCSSGVFTDLPFG